MKGVGAFAAPSTSSVSTAASTATICAAFSRARTCAVSAPCTTCCCSAASVVISVVRSVTSVMPTGPTAAPARRGLTALFAVVTFSARAFKRTSSAVARSPRVWSAPRPLLAPSACAVSRRSAVCKVLASAVSRAASVFSAGVPRLGISAKSFCNVAKSGSAICRSIRFCCCRARAPWVCVFASSASGASGIGAPANWPRTLLCMMTSFSRSSLTTAASISAKRLRRLCSAGVFLRAGLVTPVATVGLRRT